LKGVKGNVCEGNVCESLGVIW